MEFPIPYCINQCAMSVIIDIRFPYSETKSNKSSIGHTCNFSINYDRIDRDSLHVLRG